MRRVARVGERVGDARERECVRDDAVDGVGAGAGAGGDEVERRGAARGRARARGTVDDGAAGCRRDGEGGGEGGAGADGGGERVSGMRGGIAERG